ncbi:MAG: hypothetical protein SOU51_07525 [Collinsella sp.]|nr:hypothetical protein [Collinsella sp.]
MKKLDGIGNGVVKVSLAVTLLLSVVALVLSLMSMQEANGLKRGFEDGFRIDGVYRDRETGLTSIAFHEEDGNRWQFVSSGGEAADGTFKVTEDPNAFTLVDQSGNEYGFVHLSYASAGGDEGVLYLNDGTSVLAFDKAGKYPAFIETQ